MIQSRWKYLSIPIPGRTLSLLTETGAAIVNWIGVFALPVAIFYNYLYREWQQKNLLVMIDGHLRNIGCKKRPLPAQQRNELDTLGTDKDDNNNATE